MASKQPPIAKANINKVKFAERVGLSPSNLVWPLGLKLTNNGKIKLILNWFEIIFTIIEAIFLFTETQLLNFSKKAIPSSEQWPRDMTLKWP